MAGLYKEGGQTASGQYLMDVYAFRQIIPQLNDYKRGDYEKSVASKLSAPNFRVGRVLYVGTHGEVFDPPPYCLKDQHKQLFLRGLGLYHLRGGMPKPHPVATSLR